MTPAPLPRLIVLTDRTRCDPGVGLLDLMEAVIDAGARAVLVREKDRPRAERAAVAGRLRSRLAPVGGRLLVASDPTIPADGVHLAAGDRFPRTPPIWRSRGVAAGPDLRQIGGSGSGSGIWRSPGVAAGPDLRQIGGSGGEWLVGRSCHSSTDVRAAAEEGCDYVTVSPVHPTPSKPGYGPAMGADGLAAVCEVAPVPVYALGGVTPANAAACLRAGAAGVAVMGGIGGDPATAATTVADLLAQLDETPEPAGIVPSIPDGPA